MGGPFYVGAWSCCTFCTMVNPALHGFASCIRKVKKEALVFLRENNDLIVKPADKGGAIVIWPRESYLMEAYKQLNNNLHHKLITTDQFPQLITDIKQFVKTIYNKQFID